MNQDDLQIREPCQEDWNAMEGGGATRFCKVCRKHVHDLSAMTRTEAREVLRTVDRPCIRYTCDSAGGVAFRPEPAPIVPIASVRKRPPPRLRPVATLAVAIAACAPHESERTLTGRVDDDIEEVSHPLMGMIASVDPEPEATEAEVPEIREQPEQAPPNADQPCDSEGASPPPQAVKMGKAVQRRHLEPAEVRMGDWAGP